MHFQFKNLITLSQAGERRADNYLPLRHLAALLVIYGHSYALSRHPPGVTDLIAKAMPGFYAGNFAVYLFFSISGYLVTLSLIRHPSLFRYVHHRILRVYPAYLLCLLVCVFAFGLAFTTLAKSAYLQSAEIGHYLSRNLLPVTVSWELPGVFADNPTPRVVNGTLRSLGLEVRWHFYLGLLAALTVVRRRWAFTLVALALIGYGGWEWWIGKPDTNDYRTLSQTFLVAALCAHWRNRVPVSHGLMAGLTVLAALANGSHWFGAAAITDSIYATFWIAYALPKLHWPGSLDYSYGLFLYGYPVQQALIALQQDIAPLTLFALSATIAAGLAALSWHALERPALSFRFPRKPVQRLSPG